MGIAFRSKPVLGLTGVGRNIRRDLIKTPSRRHFESKRTSKTGSTSKIGSRNGFVRFGIFCIFRSLSPPGVLNSGYKLTVTYYGEITTTPGVLARREPDVAAPDTLTLAAWRRSYALRRSHEACGNCDRAFRSELGRCPTCGMPCRISVSRA